jgi:hypothetical protein
MKEALDGSTHRHFPATARVCRARRSLPKTRTQVRVHQVWRGLFTWPKRTQSAEVYIHNRGWGARVGRSFAIRFVSGFHRPVLRLVFKRCAAFAVDGALKSANTCGRSRRRAAGHEAVLR